MLIVERVLRVMAIGIAILGFIDPVLTLPWRERPVVSVAVVEPDLREMSPLPQGTLSARDADALKAQVIAALDDEFDVRERQVSDAVAIVLVGDGRSPAPAASDFGGAGTIVAAVVPSPAASAVRIVRVDAPRRAHVSAAVPVAVQVEARGLGGRTSAIVAHADGLEVARTTYKWPADARDAQATIDLSIPPLQVGPARFTISVIDGTEDSANGGARATADVAVEVEDRPVRVLFVNGRPSWATRFIERALDGNPRFSVSAATRVSRGVTATSAGAPASLAASDPDSHDAIVIGAPELLTQAEVGTLRAFVRERGGLLIVAPDRMIEAPSPVLDLLPARRFTERLLDEPAALTSMFASEFAIPDALLPGAETLLRISESNSPVIVGSPLGDGYTIVSGALDAWRYRDRAKDGFDRFWRDTIGTRAAAVPAPVEITFDPAVAAPNDPISLQVSVRSSAASAATAAATAATTVAARLAASPSPSSAPSPAPSPSSTPAPTDTTPTPIRLWPDARPSAYHGAINAPSRVGVYAVSVQLDGQAAPSRAYFRVEQNARIARPAWPGLQAFVEARRGLLVTSDRLDRLTRHLRESVRPANTRHARHPLRSAWWILPFAGCLGGEWFLRRRRGER
jgi:hypothetical protein